MNTAAMKRRLWKFEQKLRGPDDGTFTLEELCRKMCEFPARLREG